MSRNRRAVPASVYTVVDRLEPRCLLSTTVNVPATACLFLANEPDGTTSVFDVAPTNSPPFLAVKAGDKLTFTATGKVYYSGGPSTTGGTDGPEGETDKIVAANNGLGTHNIAVPNVPIDGLIGVFLDNNAPDSTFPPMFLDFTTQAQRDFTTLSPQLKQGFFIGDGKTSGGATQTFVVPTGATKLFFSTGTNVSWYNHVGSFNVTVTTSGGTTTGAKIGGNVTAGTTPLANTTVYLDANNNGKLDAGEKSTLSSATDGGYGFTGLAAGTYNIRVVVPSGYTISKPTTGVTTVTVTSTGVSSGNAFVLAKAGPKLAVTGAGQTIANNGTATSSSNATDFGAVAVGASKTQTYTIKNTGSAALTLSSLPTLTGPNAAEFRLLTAPAATVAAGASTTFTVEYVPDTDLKASATIVFKDNDASATTFAFAIGGTGTGYGYGAPLPDHTSGSYMYRTAIAPDSAGNLYVSGSVIGKQNMNPKGTPKYLTQVGDQDAYIAEYDKNGLLLWAEQIGTKGASIGLNALALDASGSLYASAVFEGTVDVDPGSGTTKISTIADPKQFNNAAAVLKFTTAGKLVWARAFANATKTARVDPKKVAVDRSGNVTIAGSFLGTVDFDPGSATHNIVSNAVQPADGDTHFFPQDLFVVRLNAAGSYVWADGFLQDKLTITEDQTKYKSGARLADLAVDASGNAIVTGNYEGKVDFDPGTGTKSLTAADKTDPNYTMKIGGGGAVSWLDVGPATGINSWEVATDAAGNVYTLGLSHTATGAGTVDLDPGSGVHNVSLKADSAVLVRLDANGKFVWGQAVASETSNVTGAYVTDLNLAVGPDGDVVAAGTFTGTIDLDPGSTTHTLTSLEAPMHGGQDIFLARYAASSGAYESARPVVTTQGMAESVSDLTVGGNGDVFLMGSLLAGADITLYKTIKLPTDLTFDPAGKDTFPFAHARIDFLTRIAAPATPKIVASGNGNAIGNGSGVSTVTGQDFGSFKKGSTKTVQFSIKNNGTSTLALSKFTLGGTNPGDWSLANLPLTVAAGETAVFSLIFKPTAAGTRAALLSILTNDPIAPAFTFSVTGKGT